MAKIWGYVRVSTKEQNEDRQVEELLPKVTSPAHLVVEKQSGKDFERPRYKWLKELMDDGDTLVIKSLDRLGRNYEQIKEEWRELTNRNIYIEVLDTPMLNTNQYKDNDLMSKFISNLVLEVLSFVAENERKNIKQRQAEGIAVAKAKGKKFGRPAAQFPENWLFVYNRWKNHEITARRAMQEMNLKKSTFYNLVQKYEEKQGEIIEP